MFSFVFPIFTTSSPCARLITTGYPDSTTPPTHETCARPTTITTTQARVNRSDRGCGYIRIDSPLRHSGARAPGLTLTVLIGQMNFWPAASNWKFCHTTTYSHSWSPPFLLLWFSHSALLPFPGVLPALSRVKKSSLIRKRLANSIQCV